jgi:hypothetical protein
MIESKFVKNILELLLDGDKDGISLRQQVSLLTQEAEVEYTCSGAFYSFTHEQGIEKVKINIDITTLDGVKITSPQLETSAEAILHIKNGLISTLEIWYHGRGYPHSELTAYKIEQIWKGSPGRQIEVS